MTSQILLIDDDPQILSTLRRVFEREGCEVFTAEDGEAGIEIAKAQQDLAAIYVDFHLPGMNGIELLPKLQSVQGTTPIIMITGDHDTELTIRALQLGASDFIEKPIDLARLQVSLRQARQTSELKTQLSAIEDQKSGPFDEIITRSQSMLDLFDLIERAAVMDITVLLLGESGTGKELLARAVHRASNRKGKFIALNCAAIPKELLESELFGHKKGSFTGAAADRKGRIEQAQGGTLLLDEIGDLPLDLQAKLLRVLQERAVVPVGGDQEIQVDVRFVAATHKDLRQKLEDESFREDLYYRLNQFPVEIPALRDRPEDIPVLAQHFLLKHHPDQEKHEHKSFSTGALEVLENYSWPGNVRELENVIARAIVLAGGAQIEIKHLAGDILAASDIHLERKTTEPQSAVDQAPALIPLWQNPDQVWQMKQVEKVVIEHVLEIVEQNVSEAAKRLKLGRATLYRKIEEYGLVTDAD